MDVKKIKEIIKLLNRENIESFSYKDQDCQIDIVTKDNKQSIVKNPQIADSLVSKGQDGLLEIRSPQIGNFYIKESPSSEENFVEVGDTIEKGDKIGIIEAMKLFTDVYSDIEGTVEEILVENGQSVAFNEVLMLVSPCED